jgi:hypothetical protein
MTDLASVLLNSDPSMPQDRPPSSSPSYLDSLRTSMAMDMYDKAQRPNWGKTEWTAPWWLPAPMSERWNYIPGPEKGSNIREFLDRHHIALMGMRPGSAPIGPTQATIAERYPSAMREASNPSPYGPANRNFSISDLPGGEHGSLPGQTNQTLKLSDTTAPWKMSFPELKMAEEYFAKNPPGYDAHTLHLLRTSIKDELAARRGSFDVVP